MGIIRAITSSVGGSLADQWLEIIQADNMSDTTVIIAEIAVYRDNKRNQNKRGTYNVITDKSLILVEQSQFMLLVDGGIPPVVVVN